MTIVAGTDPGTSGLDLVVLADGRVLAQSSFRPDELRSDPAAPVRWLHDRGPFDLIAGPSGYGLPLLRAADCTERDLDLMALVRPDDTGRGQGVLGFKSLLRELRASGLPVVFLPGVIHLPTVPAHRKINRIDLGTADKLCVAALALYQAATQHLLPFDRCHLCVVELGSAFTACLVLHGGRLVDGLGGTGGPVGWRSAGAWDGETAYLLSPLSKSDLFAGGVSDQGDPGEAIRLYREALVKTVAGLRAVTPFEQILLSGRLVESEPELIGSVMADLERFGHVELLESLPGARVKHAAQGAALLADGLAGGAQSGLVGHLGLRQARGSVLDWLRHPRAEQARAMI